MFDMVLNTPMIKSKILKMDEKKKNTTKKQHYAQHRELVSLSIC